MRIILLVTELIFCMAIVVGQSIDNQTYEIITPENSSKLAELFILGTGEYFDTAWFPDSTKLAVASSLGILVYERDNFDEPIVLSELAKGITTVEVSMSGRYLALIGTEDVYILDTFDDNNIVKMSDYIQDMINPSPNIRNLSFSMDERLLAFEVENNFYIWDLIGQNLILEHSGSNPIFAPNSQKVVFLEYVNENQQFLRFWNLVDDEEISSIQIEDFVYYLSISADSSILHLAVINDLGDSNIILVSLETEQEVANISGFELGLYLTHIESCETCNLLAFVDYQSTTTPNFSASIILWDTNKRLANHILSGYTSPVTDIAFSPDGRLIATSEENSFGTNESYIRVWDTSTGELIAKSDAINWTNIRSVQFSPDGTMLVSTHNDGVVRIWNTNTLNLITNLGLGHADVDLASLSNYLVLGSTTGNIYTMEVDVDSMYLSTISSIQVEDFPLRDVAITPDGQTIAFSTGNSSDDRLDGQIHTLQLWETNNEEARTLYSSETELINAIAFSNDGSILATTINDRSLNNNRTDVIQLWDVETGERIGDPLTESSDFIYSLAFSPDDNLLAAGSCGGRDVEQVCNAGQIYIWDLTTHELISPPFSEHTSAVYSLRFSSDGEILASGSGGAIFYGSALDFSVALWNLDGILQLPIIPDHIGQVTSLEFSPDGMLLASGSGHANFEHDGTMRIWDAATGQALALLGGGLYEINDIVFYPDQNLILTGNNDGTVRVYGIEAE